MHSFEIDQNPHHGTTGIKVNAVKRKCQNEDHVHVRGLDHSEIIVAEATMMNTNIRSKVHHHQNRNAENIAIQMTKKICFCFNFINEFFFFVDNFRQHIMPAK